MRIKPNNTRPATGDVKMNQVLAGRGKIRVDLKLAEKVGGHLGKLAKTDARRAASLVARMIGLEVAGKLTIVGKAFHGLPSNARAALYNPALTELTQHHEKIANEFGLPDPISLAK